MVNNLPSDFPAALAGMLGLEPGRRMLPGPAPITEAMREALAEARKTKGKTI